VLFARGWKPAPLIGRLMRLGFEVRIVVRWRFNDRSNACCFQGFAVPHGGKKRHKALWPHADFSIL